MFPDLEERIDRIVSGLLKGRRLRVGTGEAAERAAIMAAAELAAAREGHPRMRPAFRRRLAATLRTGAEPGWVTRRTALGAVAGLAVGTVSAAALGRAVGIGEAPGRAASEVAGGVMQPANGRWIEVAAFSALSETAPIRVVAGDAIAFLFLQGDQVHAVSGVCTHWPCVLAWKPDAAASGVLNCPCHNVGFRSDGTATSPAYEMAPLPVFQVRVVNGRVLVYSP